MIVVCVLRSGGDFDAARYVKLLRHGVSRNLHVEHRFVCLTDREFMEEEDPPVDWYVLLRTKWPRWWPKIEMFRPGLWPRGERILYFDLDTAIVDDITPLAEYEGGFAVLNDVMQGERMIGSGMMMWDPESLLARRIWDRFLQHPQDTIRKHRARMDYWIQKVVGDDAERIQDLFPGMVVSYKGDLNKGRRALPEGASVVCFHGRPRPHETPKGDPIGDAWRGEYG